MYISKLQLDPRHFARLGMYGEHQALWGLFADHPNRKRDFLYRTLDNGAFLAVSQRVPQDEMDVWDIKVKEYDPKLKSGERIFFSLRVNAVRKTRDANGRQVRHDIVQDQRKQLIEKGIETKDMPRREVLAQEAALEWLQARRDSLGFEVEKETLLVDAYQRYQVRKKAGARPITLSVLDLKGFARVEDPDATKKTLMDGIGCAKGLGCGMMLIRRA